MIYCNSIDIHGGYICYFADKTNDRNPSNCLPAMTFCMMDFCQKFRLVKRPLSNIAFYFLKILILAIFIEARFVPDWLQRLVPRSAHRKKLWISCCFANKPAFLIWIPSNLKITSIPFHKRMIMLPSHKQHCSCCNQKKNGSQ